MTRPWAEIRIVNLVFHVSRDFAEEDFRPASAFWRWGDHLTETRGRTERLRHLGTDWPWQVPIYETTSQSIQSDGLRKRLWVEGAVLTPRLVRADSPGPPLAQCDQAVSDRGEADAAGGLVGLLATRTRRNLFAIPGPRCHADGPCRPRAPGPRGGRGRPAAPGPGLRLQSPARSDATSG